MDNQTHIPDQQRAVERKRADIIARRAERKLYDREKTIALATGVICALIFLGGTALGSYHAFVMIGAFAGVLATASYLIADAVIIWAAVVDYHEDKNPMEWAAWAVKYGLSLYMLMAGGCIAYKLFNLSEAETAITQRTGAATQAYNDCVAAARTNRQRAKYGRPPSWETWRPSCVFALRPNQAAVLKLESPATRPASMGSLASKTSPA